MRKKIYSFLSLLMLFIISSNASAADQQSNFTIAPSPIAYPYFGSGIWDSKMDISYVSISMDEMSLKGAFFDIKGRYSFNSFLAINGQLGGGWLYGTMPGIGPMTTPFGWYVDYSRIGEAELSFSSLRPSLNLELQPVKGFILFGGINGTYTTFTIKTPYRLRRISDNYLSPYTYTDNLTIDSSLSGFQCGIQIDVPLSRYIRISPFAMYSSFSGSMTMEDDPGTAGASKMSYSGDIPSSTAYSFGMDIIIDDISIGTILQQIQSSEKNNKDAKVIMITLGYHWGGSGSQEEKQAEIQKEQKRKEQKQEEEIQVPSEETQISE